MNRSEDEQGIPYSRPPMSDDTEPTAAELTMEKLAMLQALWDKHKSTPFHEVPALIALAREALAGRETRQRLHATWEKILTARKPGNMGLTVKTDRGPEKLFTVLATEKDLDDLAAALAAWSAARGTDATPAAERDVEG